MYLHKDIVIGEEKFKIGTELNESILQKFIESNILTLEISITNSISKGPYLLQTLLNDRNENKSGATVGRQARDACAHFIAFYI